MPANISDLEIKMAIEKHDIMLEKVKTGEQPHVLLPIGYIVPVTNEELSHLCKNSGDTIDPVWEWPLLKLLIGRRQCLR